MNLESKEVGDIGGLAAVINARLSAEARIKKAIAFVWLCGGIAVASCLTGLGIGSALLGYSHTLSVKPAADQTAKAIVDAFRRSS